MKLYAFTFFLILSLYSTSSIAQTGCVRTTTGVLYTTMTGVDYTGGTVSNPHSVYCLRNTGTCTIKISSTVYTAQIKVTYTAPIGCPLDDNVYVLLAVVTIGGYLKLRRRVAYIA
jgi:hypothetical protein